MCISWFTWICYDLLDNAFHFFLSHRVYDIFLYIRPTCAKEIRSAIFSGNQNCFFFCVERGNYNQMSNNLMFDVIPFKMFGSISYLGNVFSRKFIRVHCWRKSENLWLPWRGWGSDSCQLSLSLDQYRNLFASTFSRKFIRLLCWSESKIYGYHGEVEYQILVIESGIGFWFM